jgi:S-ribosylhomocysteine lyase
MPDIDHTRMTPPSLRIVREHPLAGEDAYVWDFRIAQPNVAHLAMPVIHSIEHFLGTALPAASPKVLHVGVMGCQTGFNIVTIGISSFDEMSDLVAGALRSAVDASEVPLANPVDCGWAESHSLVGAQRVSTWLLSRRDDWNVAAAGAEAIGAEA